jgi:hypothetical protein
MKTGRNRILAVAAVCTLLVTAATEPAAANSIPTQTDVVWIGVGVAAIGAGIGIGVFYALHHQPSLIGCAVSGANGLELQNKGDQQTYSLVGAIGTIKPGERICISGKKVKKTAGRAPQFLVEHLSKDFGPCAAQSATP